MTRPEAAEIIDKFSCENCGLLMYGECRQKDKTCITAKALAIAVLREDPKEEMKKLNMALAKECDRLARENKTLKFELEKLNEQRV